MYRLLKVADTAEWIASKTVGSAPYVVKPKSRSHFYIHCDCLEYHYINNNVSRILRTIVNTAAINERAFLSFDNPRYYRLSKRIVGSINMYITDGLHDNILKFNPGEELSYDLHFRLCQEHFPYA